LILISLFFLFCCSATPSPTRCPSSLAISLAWHVWSSILSICVPRFGQNDTLTFISLHSSMDPHSWSSSSTISCRPFTHLLGTSQLLLIVFITYALFYYIIHTFINALVQFSRSFMEIQSVHISKIIPLFWWYFSIIF